MNITKLFKRTSLALAAAAMAASMTAIPLTSSAETSANTAVNNDRSGIVQVETYYQPTGQDPITIQTGTGFLINENTLLTCDHVTDVSDYISDIEEYFSLIMDEKHKFDKDYVGIQIAVLGDVKAEATIQEHSEAGDYAILHFDKKLTTKTPLILGDSDAVQQTEQVYALGYPANVTDFQNQLNYTAYDDDDVTITQGNISKTNYVSTDIGMTGVQLFQHSAYLSGGNSGGPLVNEKGEVIGIANAASIADDYYYAIEINQIKKLLDILDIPYPKPNVSTPATDPTDEPEPTEPTQEISNPDSDITQPTVPTPTEPEPEPEPETDKTIPWVLIGILGAAALIVIILIIVLVAKGGKKPEPVPAAPAPVPPRPPINPSGAPRPISPTPPMGAMGGMDNGAGETSLLNSGAGETSILGGGAAASRVTIIRKKTGTSIPVNTPEFIIGKENSRVNYCVNNNAVSRQHAKISANNGSYFITDMNSSNFTFLNGRQIPANTPQLLHSGDVFKLADEEFEFRG